MPKKEKLSARYPKCFFCSKAIIQSRNPIDQEKYVICDTECGKPIIFHRDCADENMAAQKKSEIVLTCPKGHNAIHSYEFDFKQTILLIGLWALGLVFACIFPGFLYKAIQFTCSAEFEDSDLLFADSMFFIERTTNYFDSLIPHRNSSVKPYWFDPGVYTVGNKMFLSKGSKIDGGHIWLSLYTSAAILFFSYIFFKSFFFLKKWTGCCCCCFNRRSFFKYKKIK